MDKQEIKDELIFYILSKPGRFGHKKISFCGNEAISRRVSLPAIFSPLCRYNVLRSEKPLLEIVNSSLRSGLMLSSVEALRTNRAALSAAGANIEQR